MFDLSRLISDAATEHPDSLFVLDGPMDVAPVVGTTVSYKTMNDLVERIAAVLVDRGVRPGDTVAVFKTQGCDLLPIACSIARAGGIPAMIAPALGRPEARELLAILRPHRIIMSADRLPGGADESVVVVDEIAEAVEAGWGKEFLSAPLPTSPAPEDTYLITHTSGTTGVPKLVPQARRGTQMPITIQSNIARLMRFDEPAALAVSFVHGRTFSAFATAIDLGLKLLMISNPAGDGALALMREHQPAVVETHPNMAMAWEAELRRDSSAFANVRIVISTFDAIHPRTVRTLLGAAGRKNAVLFQSYGQTETGPATQKMYLRRHLQKFDGREVGRRFIGMTRVRILDENGRRLRAGEVGRIGVRTKGLALDYLGQHGRYLANFVDGWWLMGDHGRLDRKGRLYLEDRSNDRIPGLASVLRVEDDVIEALPEIREAVLVGDGIGSHLVYVPYPGAHVTDAQVLSAAGCGRMPNTTAVQMSWDDLPLTSTWKVRRALLLERLRVQETTVPVHA